MKHKKGFIKWWIIALVILGNLVFWGLIIFAIAVAAKWVIS